LDEIIGIDSEEILFKSQLFNYLDPSDKELRVLQNLVQHLESIKGAPDVEFVGVFNRLPRALNSTFSYLKRYQLFKWAYLYVDKENVMPFSESVYPSKIAQVTDGYNVAIRNVAKTSYIWDSMLFEHMVSDIRYFHSVYLITDEEKEHIKEDLYALIDYMSDVATKGYWPETGNKVKLYISQVYIDTNYSYYFSPEVKNCRIHAFGKNTITTNDMSIMDDFKSWLQLRKRASIQISEAGEKSRIDYFYKQRRLIDTL
jgi:hypothetical protein